MPKRTTDRSKHRFLQAIDRGMSVVDATAHAGVDRTTPYTWELTDPEFAALWSHVRNSRLRQLVDSSMDFALEGDTAMMRFLINRLDKSLRTATPTVGEIIITAQEVPPDGSHPLPFLSVDP